MALIHEIACGAILFFFVGFPFVMDCFCEIAAAFGRARPIVRVYEPISPYTPPPPEDETNAFSSAFWLSFED